MRLWAPVGVSLFFLDGFFSPEFKSDFASFEDEMNAIRASCQIPLVDGSILYRIRGDAFYIDGEVAVDSKMIDRYFSKKYKGCTICIIDIDCSNLHADIVPSTQYRIIGQ